MRGGGLTQNCRTLERCGVHKRVWTPGTAEYQGSRQVPTIDGFLRATQAVVAESAEPVTHIFLATDDKHAVSRFEAAFGDKLVVRGGVKRVGGGLNYADSTLNEVHIRSPHNPGCGLSDAVDVLVDAMLLSCCRAVVHMDSNVSSAVGILSPSTQMRHVVDVLGRLSWEWDGAVHPATGGLQTALVMPQELCERGYWSETGGGEEGRQW